MIELYVLAGGVGERLKKITGQSVPKNAVTIQGEKRGIDLLHEQLGRLWPATFGANNYYYWYQKETKNVVWNRDGQVVRELIDRDRPMVIIPSDCIIDLSFIPKMVDAHKKGTISWAVTSYQHPLMASYNGCTIEDGAIVGRGGQSVMRTPVMIVEPEILKPYLSGSGEDLYWNVMPRIEADNAARLQQGESSILNAFQTDAYCFDYGTPERLETLRKELHEITSIR